MNVSMIAAIGKNGELGKDNKLLWRLSADLKKFKETTLGHYLIMGRKTYESIGRPLPGRTTIVVTRNRDYQAAGCLIAFGLDEAIEMAKEQGAENLFVCGGGELYQQALESVSKIYLSLVDFEGEADAFFPKFEEEEWKLLESESFQKDEKNQYDWEYRILGRIQ